MPVITRKFTVKELEEKYDLPWGAISDEANDNHRWYTIRDLVFKADDGYFYGVAYMDPATEMQENQDRWYYDYKTGLVSAIRVKEIEVVATRWVPVSE